VGIMKALFENNLLPEVITASSAGSLMAALVCCRTDEELRRDGVFTTATCPTFRMLEAPWLARFQKLFKTGSMFDPVDGFHKCAFVSLRPFYKLYRSSYVNPAYFRPLCRTFYFYLFFSKKNKGNANIYFDIFLI
jgi:hypothetical protein